MRKTLSVLLSFVMLISVFGLPAWAGDAAYAVSSYEEMTAYVRAQLTARNGSFRFRYTGSDYGEPTFEDICAYGVDATAGDYLRLSFRALPRFLRQPDRTYLVDAEFYTDAAQEAAVDTFVSDVLSGCPDGADIEKAEYIYGYLCDNVAFDLENLYNEDDLLKYTAYGAAVNGRAVCQGFATLFYRLALGAGLDCRIVTGTRSSVKHAWNIVRQDDKWYHVDASSGAQFIDPSGYFMTGLPNGYAVTYYMDSWIDPYRNTPNEIRSYSFAAGDNDLFAGSLEYTISYTINKTTGVLTISGAGAISEKPENTLGYFPWKELSLVSAVVVEEGVTELASVFKLCILKQVSLPSTLTDIGPPNMFRYGYVNSSRRSPLERVTVDERNPVYHTDGNCLIKTAEKEVVLGFQDSVIPSDGSVTKIGDYAFYGVDRTSVDIPDCVTSIGDHAFADTALTEISLPDSITSIGDHAFADTALTEISLPDSLTEIGTSAFEGADLKQVRIPDSVTAIGAYAFADCPLTAVTIDEGMTAPIPSTMLSRCNMLRSVTVKKDNPKYSTDEFGVLFDREKTVLITYPSGRSAGSFYEIPAGVSVISEEAFYGTRVLYGVSIPDSVTVIGDGAFYASRNLSSVELPDGLVSIGAHAFDWTDLTQIAIPDSVTAVGKHAFHGCEHLAEVTLSARLTEIAPAAFARTAITEIAIPDGVTEIGMSAFEGCDSLARVLIPASVETISKYAFWDSKNVTIYGVAGSYAEEFANGNKIPFVAVCPVTNGPHDVVAVDATGADCLHGAYSAGERCADCGAWITEPTLLSEPLGHDPAEPVRENVTEPTCTAEGSYDNVVYCARCGEVLASTPEKLATIPHADGDHNGYCDDCGENICAHPQTVLVDRTDATCTENGYSGDTVCAVCGVTLSYGATVFAPGHRRVCTQEAAPSTCVDAGHTAQYACSVCGAVLTESEELPTGAHTDADGDGRCDVCLSPVDCTVYGRCGDSMFWYAENGVLVISGGGDSYDLDDVPWTDCAEEIDTVYLREGVEAVDADGFSGLPKLDRIVAPEDASVDGTGIPVTRYAFSGEEARLAGATGFTFYDLLNAAHILCVDHTVASLRFDTLRLNAADGAEYTEYDIMKNGKIIDENHFRIPSGAALTDFCVGPLNYPCFNDVFEALAREPDKILILRILCTDLLPDGLKADADLYTEQIAIRFIEHRITFVNEDGEAPENSIVDHFHATLAALLGLFKKVVKFFKNIFGK